MNLLMSKLNSRYDVSDYSDNPHYLAHEDEPVDLYKKYNDSDFRPIRGGRNLHNLFSDSEIKNYYWLEIARKYLRKI
jgi:hypothetical protein